MSPSVNRDFLPLMSDCLLVDSDNCIVCFEHHSDPFSSVYRRLWTGEMCIMAFTCLSTSSYVNLWLCSAFPPSVGAHRKQDKETKRDSLWNLFCCCLILYCYFNFEEDEEVQLHLPLWREYHALIHMWICIIDKHDVFMRHMLL